MQLLKERRIPEPQYEEGSDYAVSRAGAFWDTLAFSAFLQRQHVACTVKKHCGTGGKAPRSGHWLAPGHLPRLVLLSCVGPGPFPGGQTQSREPGRASGTWKVCPTLEVSRFLSPSHSTFLKDCSVTVSAGSLRPCTQRPGGAEAHLSEDTPHPLPMPGVAPSLSCHSVLFCTA